MPDNLTVNASSFNHTPVLANEVLAATHYLQSEMLQGGLIIDATLGGGGHCALLLDQYPHLRVQGLDQDPFARIAASQHLAQFNAQLEIIATNFEDFTPDEPAVLVLADLGVSSYQLNTAQRGFSFLVDGPLDMRMNPEQEVRACDIIEQLNEKELADIIFNYGEEKRSRRIARRIKKDLLNNGSYKSTTELAYAVAGCYPPNLRRGRIHPATKTFQALRIAVNNELKALENFLNKVPNWLVAGGLLNIISFHSLEDRLVKKAFLKDQRLQRITTKPIIASPEEISSNARSRSAKYRIARKHSLLV